MEIQNILTRLIVFIIAIIAGIISYKTPALNNVKDAYIYRISFTVTIMRGIVFIAKNVLQLWTN